MQVIEKSVLLVRFFTHSAKLFCRDSDLFTRTVFKCDTNRSEVRQKSSSCFVVGMADIVSCHRAFAADLAFS